MIKIVLSAASILVAASLTPAVAGEVSKGPETVRVQLGVSALNLRAGPGTSYQVIDKLRPGSCAREIKDHGNWTKVKTCWGKIGWVYAPYLTETERRESWTFVNTKIDRLNLRTGPSTQYRVIRSMPISDRIIVLENKGNWSKLRHVDTGDTGWSYTGYLSDVD